MKRHSGNPPPTGPPAPGPGQESVWDYPRPPRLESSPRWIQVRFGGILLADSRRTLRVLETSHPPVYYLPPADVRMEYLVPSPRRSWCEWKGLASYYDVVVPDAAAARRADNAAWFFAEPTLPYKELRGWVAFYPSAMDACLVDGEPVQAQPGDFYGGWITRDVLGPFKGDPGTSDW
jgi:uncharacterized protein (DUF427 family)